MKFVAAHIVILTKCLRCAQNKEFSESLAQDCSHQTAEPGKMYMAMKKFLKSGAILVYGIKISDIERT